MATAIARTARAGSPAGLLVTTPFFQGEAGRGLAVALGYPAMLLLAAGLVALWRWGRGERTQGAATGGVLTTLNEEGTGR